MFFNVLIQQRYAAGIFGARTIRPPKESGVAKDIDRQVDELEKKLDAVIDTKKITPESAELQKTLNQLKEKLSAGNKLQSDINASKKKLLSLEAKEADQAQARAEEAETDLILRNRYSRSNDARLSTLTPRV